VFCSWNLNFKKKQKKSLFREIGRAKKEEKRKSIAFDELGAKKKTLGQQDFKILGRQDDN
jgi:hypothetical protein